MSGIYGVFRFDGAPVESETLTKMREAMAHYGPDDGGEWREGPVGLGHLLLRVTPEDRFEVQPVKGDDITLVTFARLDNRDELLREFGMPKSEHPSIPDSSLVLEAYRRWGEDCPDHLNGDWQFAAWDGRRRSLFVARDHQGNTGLYYYSNSRFIVFASSLKALLALPDVPRRPDMLKMAQVLTAWLGEGWRTAYEDLYRLPPAHIMRVSKSGTETKRYWYPENLSPLHLANDQEYVDQFLQIYDQAVRSRLRSARPIAVTLSGGLDSGSVVAMAAPILAAESKSLTAFTSVPFFDIAGSGMNRTCDEWYLASATARMAGDNIVHLPLTSEGITLLSAIEHKIEIHNEPGHASSNHYWLEDIQSQAKSLQVGTLLTGQCGNFTVSYSGGGSLQHSLLTGDFSAAARILRYCEPNPWLALKRHVLKPLLLPGIRLYRYHFKSKGLPWHQYSSIRSDFAEEILLGKHMRKSDHDPTFTIIPSALSKRAVFLESSIGARWHEAGAEYGMEVRDPTSDRRIIEFCFRTPDEQYRRRGEYRWLIRRAMNGRMPCEVINNQKRGLQAADLVHRVRSNRAEINGILDRLEGCEPARRTLDLSRMRKVLSSLEQGEDAGLASDCSCILLRGLGVGLFLSGF